MVVSGSHKLKQRRHPAGAERRGVVLQVVPLHGAGEVGAIVDKRDEERVVFMQCKVAKGLHVACAVHNTNMFFDLRTIQ